MKKLWKNYSYGILLFAVCIIFSFVAKANFNHSDGTYITVTIEDGQSLWQIAETLADEHNLTEAEFVSWVEEENGIDGQKIFPGDELVIPVSAERETLTEIAGTENN
jgi:cell division protein YceG involved in septum cleavage